jgi:tetraacyldisaccharide 4'-kinase
MRKIRLLLYPFSIIYNWITALRNFFFDIGILKQYVPPVITVAVGNLSTGGTGKTPAIEYLIEHATATRIGVISRGYGRSTRGFIELTTSHDAADVGDEPLQIKKKYGDRITSVVSEKRVEGIERLLVNHSLDLILLDDAYQHRHVKAHHYILLTSYDRPYYQDLMLPAGDLRESRDGAKRANTIIVTKCPQDLSETTMSKMTQKIKPLPYQQLLFSYIAYAKVLKGSNTLLLNEVLLDKIILVTGIAKPEPLVTYLEQFFKVEHWEYGDHHTFTKAEIQKIASQEFVITTEKDYMRLEKHQLKQVYYLPMEMKFIGNEKPKLY